MERCGVRAVGGVCGRERGEHLVFDAVAEDRVLAHLLGRCWSLAYRRETVVALWGAGRCAWAIRAGGRGGGPQSVSAALPWGVSGIAKMRGGAGPSRTGGGNSSELPAGMIAMRSLNVSAGERIRRKVNGFVSFTKAKRTSLHNTSTGPLWRALALTHRHPHYKC